MCRDDIGADSQIAGIDGNRSTAGHLTHQLSPSIGDTDRCFTIRFNVHEHAALHDRESPDFIK